MAGCSGPLIHPPADSAWLHSGLGRSSGRTRGMGEKPLLLAAAPALRSGRPRRAAARTPISGTALWPLGVQPGFGSRRSTLRGRIPSCLGCPGLQRSRVAQTARSTSAGTPERPKRRSPSGEAAPRPAPRCEPTRFRDRKCSCDRRQPRIALWLCCSATGGCRHTMRAERRGKAPEHVCTLQDILAALDVRRGPEG